MNRNFNDKSKRIKPQKRKKRSLKTRKRRNLFFRRLSILVFVLGIISLIFAGILFVVNKIFSVRNIECNETEHYSSAEIVSKSGVKIGDRMLFLNKSATEMKIYSQFPYIDEVKVETQFPNKVKILVEKAEPIYSINLQEGQYAVVSQKNKFIETRPEKSDDLINIVGANVSVNGSVVNYENKSVSEILSKLAGSFRANGLSLKEVDLTDMNNIIVNYDNRIRIEIGSEKDIEYKILTAKEIILKKLNNTDNGTLDVRNVKSENRSYFYQYNG